MIFSTVCVETITEFEATLADWPDNDRKNSKLIEEEFKRFCKTKKSKKEQFVSFI